MPRKTAARPAQSTYTAHHSALTIQAADNPSHAVHVQPDSQGLSYGSGSPRHAGYAYGGPASAPLPQTDQSRLFARPTSAHRMHALAREACQSNDLPDWIQIDPRLHPTAPWRAAPEDASASPPTARDSPHGWPPSPMAEAHEESDHGFDLDGEDDPMIEEEEDDGDTYDPSRPQSSRVQSERRGKKKARLTLKKRSKRLASTAPAPRRPQPTSIPVGSAFPALDPPATYFPLQPGDAPVVAIPYSGTGGKTVQLIKLTNVRGPRLQEYAQAKGTHELDIEDLLMVHPPTIPPAGQLEGNVSQSLQYSNTYAATDFTEGSTSSSYVHSSLYGLPPSEWEMYTCRVCDVTYQGKNARSVARRHLQDKHNVPLAFQSKRSRWQTVPGAPTSAAEAQERAKTAKRVWAEKNRMLNRERKRQEAAALAEREMSTLTDDGTVPNAFEHSCVQSRSAVGQPIASAQAHAPPARTQAKRETARSRLRTGSSQQSMPRSVLGQQAPYPATAAASSRGPDSPPTAARPEHARYPHTAPEHPGYAMPQSVVLNSPVSDERSRPVAEWARRWGPQEGEAIYVCDRALEVVLDQHHRNVAGDGAWSASASSSAQVQTPISAPHAMYTDIYPPRLGSAAASPAGDTPYKTHLDPEALEELVRITQAPSVPPSSASKPAGTPVLDIDMRRPGFGTEYDYDYDYRSSFTAPGHLHSLSASRPRADQSEISAPRTSQRPAHQQWVASVFESPWRDPASWAEERHASLAHHPHEHQQPMAYPIPQPDFGWAAPLFPGYMLTPAHAHQLSPAHGYMQRQEHMTPAPARRPYPAQLHPAGEGDTLGSAEDRANGVETEGIVEALLILSTPAQPRSERPGSASDERVRPRTAPFSIGEQGQGLLGRRLDIPMNTPLPPSDNAATETHVTASPADVPRLLAAPDIPDRSTAPSPTSLGSPQAVRPLMTRSTSLVDAFPASARGPSLPLKAALNGRPGRHPVRAHSYALSGGMEADDLFFASASASASASAGVGAVAGSPQRVEMELTFDTPLRQAISKRKAPAGELDTGRAEGSLSGLPIRDAHVEDQVRLARTARFGIGLRSQDGLEMGLSPLKLGREGSSIGPENRPEVRFETTGPSHPTPAQTRRRPLVQLRPNVAAGGTSPLSLAPRLALGEALKTPLRARGPKHPATGMGMGMGWSGGQGLDSGRRDGMQSGAGGGGGQMSSPLNRETAKALGLAPVWQRTPGFGETPR